MLRFQQLKLLLIDSYMPLIWTAAGRRLVAFSSALSLVIPTLDRERTLSTLIGVVWVVVFQDLSQNENCIE